MTSRKELIEEARAEAEATKNSYYTNAPLLFALADALEAAGETHTPTDDEREAAKAQERALRAVSDLAMAAHPANMRRDDAEFLRGHIQYSLPPIRAVLAVFEKAHAPTDDEREADEKAILNALYDSREAFTGVGAEVGTDETAILVDHVPDIVLALGFRRSEVPEPSAAAPTASTSSDVVSGVPRPTTNRSKENDE